MILVWIVLAVVAGAVAASTGRSFFGYFALSLFLSPIIAFIVLIVSSINNPSGKAVPTQQPAAVSMTKKCPKCGNLVSRNLYTCDKCGATVPD